VHDIGKNIVGVVLQCNNYEVIDLGVMVPSQKILDAARENNADMIGLSGLITPSLDEMCHVAAEMEREEFDVPLLIGGATTSQVHTAVKICPNYTRGQAIYVSDASRAVGVVSKLLSEERQTYLDEISENYQKVSASHKRGRGQKSRVSLKDARRNKYAIDWAAYQPVTPQFTGPRAFRDFDLRELAKYIDWTPFFATWEIKGTYPGVLEHERYGETARQLFEDAQELLKQILDEQWVRAHGVVGFWPANAVGDDDIAIYTDESRSERLATLYTLRQQMTRDSGRANTALSDFLAPEDSGVADYVGGFAVTAGIGELAIAERFTKANDDYSRIMVQALCDRLAEAFAERLHEKVRKELWGYGAHEDFSVDDLIAEKYDGIRPAPGYPAQPDHTEKRTLFDLLDAETQAGIELTESYAMTPPASVSGLYLAHPQSHYIGVGKIDRDQVEDYAKRKGWRVEEAERWLAPILNYDPMEKAVA